MIDFSLSEEQRAIRDTARDFIINEVASREAEVLRRERRGETGITLDEQREIQLKAKKFGFWGLSTPADYGGMNLPAVTQALLWTETGRTFVPFSFGGEADNILFYANEEQKQEFLIPTIEGDRKSCFAITEPGAGSDAANIKTSARRDGSSTNGDWIINGEKTFITGGNDADFAIVIAVTDPQKGAHSGSTAFLVDRSMGWTSHFIQTMGQGGPASLVFKDVRVPNRNILGEIGQGFTLGMEWIGKGSHTHTYPKGATRVRTYVCTEHMFDRLAPHTLSNTRSHCTNQAAQSNVRSHTCRSCSAVASRTRSVPEQGVSATTLGTTGVGMLCSPRARERPARAATGGHGSVVSTDTESVVSTEAYWRSLADTPHRPERRAGSSSDSALACSRVKSSVVAWPV